MEKPRWLSPRSLLRNGILITAGVTAGSTALNGIKIEPAYAQDPIPTPVATDVITGQEPPVNSPILKIDPATNECIAIIFETVDEVIPAAEAVVHAMPLEDTEPEQTPAPAEPVATENPITGQAEPTPTQVPDIAVGEPSEYTKEEVELFEDCAPDQEPVKTIIVLVDPEGIPEVTPTPEVTIEPDSIQIVLDGEFKEITKKGVNKIFKQSAPEIAAYYNKKAGKDKYTDNYVSTSYFNSFNDYLKNPSVDKSGNAFAGTITGQVANAQTAKSLGDIDAMEAFMDVAVAYYRGGKTFLKFEESPEELDELIEEWIVERNIY